MIYDITPVPKPRMTQSDRWNKRPSVLRYFAFKDECKLKKVKFGEYGCSFTFVMPMPNTWNKKKRESMCGRPHTQKPDIDNLLKALFDAVFEDDSHIWQIGGVMKIWGDEGFIKIDGYSKEEPIF